MIGPVLARRGVPDKERADQLSAIRVGEACVWRAAVFELVECLVEGTERVEAQRQAAETCLFERIAFSRYECDVLRCRLTLNLVEEWRELPPVVVARDKQGLRSNVRTVLEQLG